MKVMLSRIKLRKTKGNYKPEVKLYQTERMALKMDRYTLRVASSLIEVNKQDARP